MLSDSQNGLLFIFKHFWSNNFAAMPFYWHNFLDWFKKALRTWEQIQYVFDMRTSAIQCFNSFPARIPRNNDDSLITLWSKESLSMSLKCSFVILMESNPTSHIRCSIQFWIYIHIRIRFSTLWAKFKKNHSYIYISQDNDSAI